MSVNEQDPTLMIDEDRAAGLSFRRQLKEFLRLLSLRDIH